MDGQTNRLVTQSVLEMLLQVKLMYLDYSKIPFFQNLIILKLSQHNFNPKTKLQCIMQGNPPPPHPPPQKLLWQPRKLIFGRQPYYDPTRCNMEDDFNIFSNGRRPKKFQMEDNLNYFQMEDDLNFVLG